MVSGPKQAPSGWTTRNDQVHVLFIMSIPALRTRRPYAWMGWVNLKRSVPTVGDITGVEMDSRSLKWPARGYAKPRKCLRQSFRRKKCSRHEVQTSIIYTYIIYIIELGMPALVLVVCI